MLEISAFGDSITEGSALKANPENVPKNWPEMVSEELGITIHNFGIGGHDTQQGLNRIDDLWKYNSQITLIEFGMNDHVIVNEQGNSQVPLNIFRENILKICDLCIQHGSKPILFTPNKVIEEYYYQRHPKDWYEKCGGPNKLINIYRLEILHIAEKCGYQVIDMYDMFEKRENDIKLLLRSPINGNFLDGVHPYGVGIRLYADAVKTAIEKFL